LVDEVDNQIDPPGRREGAGLESVDEDMPRIEPQDEPEKRHYQQDDNRLRGKSIE
jgi:hypothetical protein